MTTDGTTWPTSVGIVGLGLLGGSVALDLVARDVRVLGVDPDPITRERATARGVEVVAGLGRFDDVDIVVVATPTASVARTVMDVVAAGSAPVTDLASVRRLEALGWGRDPLPDRWVGGHPMAGTERRGFAAAQRGLVVGAPWLLTPHDGVAAEALARTVELVLLLGARPVVVAADQHDRVVATTSHLPHLVAWALQAGALARGQGVVGLAGPSFRDATRVAASDPGFWADLLDRNRVAVTQALADLQSWLDEAGHASRDDLARRLEHARRVPGPVATSTTRTVVPLATMDRGLERLRELGAAGGRVVEVTSRPDGPALVVAAGVP